LHGTRVNSGQVTGYRNRVGIDGSVGWRWATRDEGKEICQATRDAGKRNQPGWKGEAGWAERDFEPMKPREIQKCFIIFWI
jgi:hypothetical protein